MLIPLPRKEHHFVHAPVGGRVPAMTAGPALKLNTRSIISAAETRTVAQPVDSLNFGSGVMATVVLLSFRPNCSKMT